MKQILTYVSSPLEFLGGLSEIVLIDCQPSCKATMGETSA